VKLQLKTSRILGIFYVEKSRRIVFLLFFCCALYKLRHTLFQQSTFFLNVYLRYSAINLYMFMRNVISITYENQNTEANVRI
jgi:hypothetical protein